MANYILVTDAMQFRADPPNCEELCAWAGLEHDPAYCEGDPEELGEPEILLDGEWVTMVTPGMYAVRIPEGLRSACDGQGWWVMSEEDFRRTFSAER